jgi:hypothetical protein
MIRKIAAIYLLSMAMLAWGFAIGKFQVFPYALIKPVYSDLKSFIEGLQHRPEKGVTEVVSDLFSEKLLSAPKAQLLADYFPGQAGLSRATEEDSPGYLLLSGLDRQVNQHAVKLIDLRDGKTLHRWDLDYSAVFGDTPTDAGSYKLFSRERLRMFHPLLLDDGSLVFNTQEGPLARIDSCSRHQWTNEHHFHHSVEKGDDGQIWVNTVIYDDASGFPKVLLWDKTKRFRDDGLARIDSDGNIYGETSIREILHRHGHVGLLYGTREFVTDRLHANDVTPALYSTEYWQKGDLLISLRDISTVMLYRPATDQIIWLKTGPWLFQHDADFVGDSKISIFSNQTVPDDGGYREQGRSDIFIYDFADDTVSRPYNRVLENVGFYSRAEGRSRVLDDGSLFVEETIRGRILKVSPEAVIWTYVNRYDDRHLGQISWSRYYESGEIDAALAAISESRCD